MNFKQEEKHMPLTQSNARIITELEMRAKLHRQEKKKHEALWSKKRTDNGSFISSVMYLYPEHSGLIFSDWRYNKTAYV